MLKSFQQIFEILRPYLHNRTLQVDITGHYFHIYSTLELLSDSQTRIHDRTLDLDSIYSLIKLCNLCLVEMD